MRLVVIGGVAAGMSAAARARRLDQYAEIVVLEKGDTVSYGACGLPYYVEGRVRDWRTLVVYTPERFSAERNVVVRTGAEVTQISNARRSVRLTGGEEVGYDRLVIATGARMKLGALRIAPGSNAFSMNTPPEAERLRQHLDKTPPGHAVVVGGGYIGLEGVDALRSNGWRVTLVQGGSHLLHRDDEHLTKALVKHLGRFGVPVMLNRRAQSIEPGRVDDIACDLVLLAPGLKPTVEIAADAGVEIGRTGAIRTTDRMETNLPGVYAAGDCAEINHLVTGRPAWIPLGTTANKMGRVAGACAVGARESFAGVVGTSIVRVCGLGVGTTGLSLAQAAKEGFEAISERVEAKDKPGYFGGKPMSVELVADRRTGRVLGGTVVGEHSVDGRINVIATALQARMKVSDVEQLDLSYAPPFSTVWDPVLIAAQQLIKKLNW
jgi:NADPH-dependent 2,4-dienoyl-CoA reductase/sulfur reductase-like enzyme